MITHKITMDLASDIGKYVPPIDVMQDDQYSRDIEFTLTANGKALNLTGYGVMIRFSKSDGTGGNYDRMPDDGQAYVINGNKVAIGLAPQVLTAAGKVNVSVALISSQVKVHTFSVQLNVHKNPGLNPHSTSYVSIAGTVPSDGWDPGVFLGTDFKGRVVARRDIINTDRDQELDLQTQEDVRRKIGAASAEEFVKLENKIPKAKTYELIATTVVEEDAPKRIVTFNADSNGNPFELTDFIIRATAGFSDGNASTLYMKVNGSLVIANGAIPSIDTNLRTFNIFFRQEADECRRVEYTASVMGENLYNSQAAIAGSRLIPQMSRAGEPPITRIELFTETGTIKEWVVGSTFELWGVRV